jgi:hypothetical protein
MQLERSERLRRRHNRAEKHTRSSSQLTRPPRSEACVGFLLNNEETEDTTLELPEGEEESDRLERSPGAPALAASSAWVSLKA